MTGARTRVTAAAGVLMVALVAGCADGAGPDASSHTTTATVTETVSSSPEADGGSDGDSSDAGSVPVRLRMTATGALYFQTPSGNIGCFLLSYGGDRWVECTLREKDFADPPRPADCQADWAPQFTLGTTAQYGVCRGDVSGEATDEVLAYGAAATNGPIRCVSETTGLTCLNEDTVHGFVLSRERYELF